MSLIPSSGKAEWMITYACNLDCYACTRASFLKEPLVPDMTLDDAREFCRQADELNWKPRIVIIGGEPTLHKQFKEFCLLAQEWSGTYAQVFSNGFGKMVNGKLFDVEKNHAVSICRDGFKLDGAVMPSHEYPFDNCRSEWDPRTFISPVDAGVEARGPCFMHSSKVCGVSVDSQGYAPCAPGGAVAALLVPAGRSRRLADLFDEVKVKEMTDALCRHCGSEYDGRFKDNVPTQLHEDVEFKKFNAYAKACSTDRFSTPMSPTWVEAFKDKK